MCLLKRDRISKDILSRMTLNLSNSLCLATSDEASSYELLVHAAFSYELLLHEAFRYELLVSAAFSHELLVYEAFRYELLATSV